MATISVPVILCSQGVVSLLEDDVTLSWVGITVTVTAPLRIFAETNGGSVAITVPPGTRTVLFPQPVPRQSLGGGVVHVMTLPFSYGAGSP